MKIETRFGLYGILTNPVVGYERLAEVMTAKKVRFVQLRMKDAPPDEVFETAVRLRRIIGGHSLFIVNDFIDVAKEAGADGVHLGQDDPPFEAARAALGPEAIIGLSTHNPRQTASACALDPSYIGVGPVFATPTKKQPDPVIGTGGLRRMLDVATVAAVALGGIDLENLGSVLAAGAENVCAVRYINASADPGGRIDELRAVMEASER